MQVIRSLLLFLLAGLCEIGGGYLIWICIKDKKSFWYAVAGCALLALYGIIATFQTAGFGRVYAVYGGGFLFLLLFFVREGVLFFSARFCLLPPPLFPFRVFCLFLLFSARSLFYVI